MLICAESTKESATIINAVEAHHGDVEPESLIACVVQAADTISAARPGARRDNRDIYKQIETVKKILPTSLKVWISLLPFRQVEIRVMSSSSRYQMMIWC